MKVAIILLLIIFVCLIMLYCGLEYVKGMLLKEMLINLDERVKKLEELHSENINN